jgi:hypothetical protein
MYIYAWHKIPENVTNYLSYFTCITEHLSKIGSFPRRIVNCHNHHDICSTTLRTLRWFCGSKVDLELHHFSVSLQNTALSLSTRRVTFDSGAILGLSPIPFFTLTIPWDAVSILLNKSHSIHESLIYEYQGF